MEHFESPRDPIQKTVELLAATLVSATGRAFSGERDFGGRIALVAEINGGGSKLVTYNLHLESRAHDELRASQMDEVLSDSAGYGPQCMLVVAGDLNVDVSKHPAAMTWVRAGFRDALAATPAPTTLPRRLFEPGRQIDWAFACAARFR